MHVSHIITSIDKGNGGPSRSVFHLIKEILKNSSKVDLITLKSLNPITKSFDNKNSTIYFLDNTLCDFFKFSLFNFLLISDGITSKISSIFFSLMKSK